MKFRKTIYKNLQPKLAWQVVISIFFYGKKVLRVVTIHNESKILRKWLYCYTLTEKNIEKKVPIVTFQIIVLYLKRE